MGGGVAAGSGASPIFQPSLRLIRAAEDTSASKRPRNGRFNISYKWPPQGSLRHYARWGEIRRTEWILNEAPADTEQKGARWKRPRLLQEPTEQVERLISQVTSACSARSLPLHYVQKTLIRSSKILQRILIRTANYPPLHLCTVYF